ncbi:hypothetical protein ONO86_03258 [Micromonospora noduli]|nr:hypothetical protein ONO86_03258 [Micromonospora noduli]
MDQLREEVTQVVAGGRGDLDVEFDDTELDPGVVLDLRLGGAQHVDGGGRLTLHAGRVGAGEHQQALVVTAHPGGQVIELEQVLQLVRVALLAFEVVQQFQLTLHQHLATAGQVDEHRVDVAPHQRLLDGDRDRAAVHRHERLSQLADLVE